MICEIGTWRQPWSRQPRWRFWPAGAEVVVLSIEVCDFGTGAIRSTIKERIPSLTIVYTNLRIV